MSTEKNTEWTGWISKPVKNKDNELLIQKIERQLETFIVQYRRLEQIDGHSFVDMCNLTNKHAKMILKKIEGGK